MHRQSNASRIRVGIVGAGLNSDYHIRFSKAYGDRAQIVGVADADLGRAKECAERHGLDAAFGSTAELLGQANPDVVHIVTPPRTHFDVVREVLEARRHVLVEKPLALNGHEAAALYELAERRNVMLCPVHNHLFDPCFRKADALIKSGELGDVINVESYYGLNTNIPAFRDYPRPNVLPWLYNLPGGVYQDFLPHPLYVLLEYTGDPRKLTVMQRTKGVLPQGLPDEIRILIDGERAFGTVTVSFATKPHLHFIRVYGTKMMLQIDINTMTTVVHALSSLPKAAQKATYNLEEASQLTRSTISNMYRFVTGKLKPYHGMMNLIHEFYDAVRVGGAPPISKQAALTVVNTMDQVYEQLTFAPLKHERIAPAPRALPPGAKRVLVTGGTGFVGRALVKRLVAEGHAVRVLARKLSSVDGLVALGAEIFWGDVADQESFDQAFTGCSHVVHLAAGTSGSDKDSQTATLQGTRNLLELATRHAPAKVVYISSCSVYGIADQPRNALVGETGTLERFPERRGTYSASKQEAERYVTDYAKTGKVPVVVLRPGTIYGTGGDLYTPMMGFSTGQTYIVIGMGGFTLPFVHVENVVEAIVQALDKKEADGEIFNVVDPERLTKREYINRVIRRIQPQARVLYMPYSILYGITWIQEIAFAIAKRRPALTRYRLTSSQRNVIYDSRKLAERLGWAPTLSLKAALDRLVDSELSRRRATTASMTQADSSKAA